MGMNRHIQFFADTPQWGIALVVMIKRVWAGAGGQEYPSEQTHFVCVTDFLHRYADVIDIDNGNTGMATWIDAAQIC